MREEGIEVTHHKNILLGSSKRTADFLLDRREAMERGKIRLSFQSEGFELPFALLHTLE